MEALAPFLATYGYIGIAAIVLLGNLGFPVPEEAVVLFAGYLTWRGALRLPLVLLVAVGSAVVGDNLGYWLGRKKGRDLLLRYGRYVAITPRLIRKGDRFFRDHGDQTVFLARFVAGVRFLAGPLAGAAEMPFPRFFLFNLTGAVVWIGVIVGLGNLFGAHLHILLRRIRHVEVLGVGFALAIPLIIWLRHRKAANGKECWEGLKAAHREVRFRSSDSRGSHGAHESPLLEDSDPKARRNQAKERPPVGERLQPTKTYPRSATGYGASRQSTSSSPAGRPVDPWRRREEITYG
jgi:membrane protein DedA with SNARE-associated domain